MAKKLNRQYLEEHRHGAQTLESFGAAVADLAMRMALERIGDEDVESLEFTVPVRIEPRTLRRTLSKDEAVALNDGTTELTIGPITIDCLTLGYGVPPFVVSIHMPV
jgi:hypothetical protein